MCEFQSSHSTNSYHRSNSSIGEDSQLTTFAPYIQAFFTQTSQRHTCCNVMLPLAFERAAGNSFVNPQFDSQVLEEQYQVSILPQIRLRFRFALLYIICMTIIWLFYFTFRAKELGTLLNLTLGFLIVISFIAVWITFTNFYKNYMTIFSGIYALLFIISCLSWLYFAGTSLSVLGNFSICIIVIICIYTVIPLKLYQCVLMALIYSVAFEVLSYMMKDRSYFHEDSGFHEVKIHKIIVIRGMLHICVHIISFHMLLMSSVRMRGTFIKVGQNLLVRRQLELEKQLKEKMITSMMPKVVADMLLKETKYDHDYTLQRHRPSASDLNLKSMFRPFHMHSMKNVSILFADIVGFTKMSSTKTAEQLVEILNDLFERFDSLCGIYGCEKISTLGDCYYCVSGCPNAREDHAFCCVEMGLGMIEAMKVFDAERHEGIKMRVGIHTGNVLCGIVGTKRVKFDVWSNDVSFSSKMESTGHPDLVHISEETKSFLNDAFNYREAEEVDGHKTFFILGRKTYTRKSIDHKLLEVQQNSDNKKLEWQSNKQKNLSTNDIPSIPATSPTQTALLQSKSLSPSPILNTRKRLASISETVTRLLSSASASNRITNEQKVLLEQRKTPNPKIIIGISEVSDEQPTNDDGTILPKKTPTINVKANYSSSKLDCDKTTEKIVPYNGNNGNQDEAPVNSEAILNLLPQGQKNDDDGDNSSINITDLRSYISQSRCDVSPFSRSGSRRSEHNSRQHHRSQSQQSNSLSPWYQTQQQADGASLSPSRKDSGFKTNSRRSSIQPQSYYKQLQAAHTHVSGYFTSSQSSLGNGNDSKMDNIMMQHLPSPASGVAPKARGDTLKACVQHLRKQSDLQLIRCVRDNARSQRSYLVKPPIRKFSLSFESPVMEKTFRNKAHRYECDEETTTPTYTLATPKFNTFIDVVVLFIIFGMIALSLFLLSPSYTKEYKVWVVCFVSFSSTIFTVLFLCSKQICRRPGKSRHFNSIFGWASNFFPWNIFGSILISLPIASILINFALVDIKKFPSLQLYYGLLLFVCLVHFCNFIQLNCWAKNCLAALASATFVFIGYTHRETSKVVNAGFHSKTMMRNGTSQSLLNDDAHWLKNYESELCLDLILVLILVFLLNREFEIGYRLSFYGNEVANMDKVRVQNMKNQADLLLHNIIPKHVAEELKNTAKYSKNHQDCGIIFASIVNFTEMYDESYLGGKEYLRVLNELIGDFDELLLRDEFKCVEKIKTIGSTYMVASGLDSTFRSDTYEHLHALLDFAVAMQNALECFNRDLLEFNLVLRIGFNYGEVTAGVIGTTKLHYDIWGDAVNVASRMDSTGVPGRIQLRKECVAIFEDLYEFEDRGKVYVKGKEFMDVCLFKSKKEETLEVFLDHQLTI